MFEWLVGISIGLVLLLVAAVFYIFIELNKIKKARKSSKGGFTLTEEYGNSDELSDKYLLDFRADRFTYGGALVGNAMSDGRDAGAEIVSKTKEKTVRVPVKPIDVLKELEKEPTHWALEGLDDKIQMLKDKEKIINQRFAKREVQSLIQCLGNRKKYDQRSEDDKTYREYFSQFDITDEEKINSVTKKHNLRMDNADIFIPELPEDATKIITEYTEKVEELCDKKPRFYIIAPEKDFQRAQAKRDPILLAQSPFGFFYYILGAWDEEMLYLPEL